MFFYASCFVVSISYDLTVLFQKGDLIQVLRLVFYTRSNSISRDSWAFQSFVALAYLLIFTFTDYLIFYTNFKISWFARTSQFELFPICCRSNIYQCNALSVDQLAYTSGCSDCTPMCFLLFSKNNNSK